MLKVIVLGASGVGKTLISAYAAKKLDLKHINLDEEFDYRGTEVNWTIFKSVVSERLKVENVLVDMGAGFYKYKQLASFLKQLSVPVIHIIVDPSESVNRTPWGKDRSLEEYIDTDITQNKLVYESASIKLNLSGLNEQAAKQEFVNCLLLLN